MGAGKILSTWRNWLKDTLGAFVRLSLVKTLADMSLAVATAKHCTSGNIGVSAAKANGTKPASQTRRWERLMANTGLFPALVMKRLAGELLRLAAQRPIALAIDETSIEGDCWRYMVVSLLVAHRAIPVAFTAYRPDAPPGGLPEVVRRLLWRVYRSLPVGADVTLLADRGLAWPAICEQCCKYGWHYAIRLQGQTRFRTQDGSERRVDELLTRQGQRWYGSGWVFKDAGWVKARIAAVWERGMKEPWLIALDTSTSYMGWRSYAKRMWIEEGFRDLKSGALEWEKTRLDSAVRLERLLLVLTLTLVLLMGLGAWIVRNGHRKQLESRATRRNSLITLAIRWVELAWTRSWPSFRRFVPYTG